MKVLNSKVLNLKVSNLKISNSKVSGLNVVGTCLNWVTTVFFVIFYMKVLLYTQGTPFVVSS